MEIKEWRKLAARSVGLLGLVLILSVFCFIHRYGNIEKTVHAQNQEKNDFGALPEQAAERQEATVSDVEEIKRISENYIVIPKLKSGQASGAYLDNEYMDFSISLTLKGVTAEGYHKKKIKRVCYGEEYTGNTKEEKDIVSKLSVTSCQTGETKAVCIRMELKDVYEPTLYETEESYYISLEKPEKLYDKIIVLDAGHGGIDEGTVSLDGKYREKDYALKVVKYLKELLDDSDYKVYCTRLGDTDITKAKRTRLANAVHADAFISIHCNASEPGETTANGMEALYSSRKEAAAQSLTSKQLAAVVLEQLCEGTGRKSRGVIRRDGLYLMNHAKVPVTIIEIGYMSNHSDLRYLLKEKNQQKIARGIYAGIENALQ